MYDFKNARANNRGLLKKGDGGIQGVWNTVWNRVRVRGGGCIGKKKRLLRV